MKLMEFKQPAIVNRIVVIGALIYCALLHSICDLKAAHMNIQHSLIYALMFYEFQLGHNATEAAKNICCIKFKVQLITVQKPDRSRIVAQVTKT